ncbi:MAG: L-threonylcarbamoyladenylate synthase [Gammaproteobacteria bacterium]|nr:L-threonylcarbamoyladenylate synthase [Gammaproteobacteria bacterium]
MTKSKLQQLDQATKIIQHGGLIAYPTEAVFGLGCDPSNQHAVERLLKLKQRSPDKGLILIAADFSQLHTYLQPLDREVAERLYAQWPGPYTWLLPAAADTPKWLTGQHDTLAVRVSAHPPVVALCKQVGALVSSSANLSGAPAARSVNEVTAYFAQQLDFIWDAPLGNAKQPSRIRDALSGRVLRS